MDHKKYKSRDNISRSVLYQSCGWGVGTRCSDLVSCSQDDSSDMTLMLVDLGGGGCIIQGEGPEGPEGLLEGLEDVRGLWRTVWQPALPRWPGCTRCAWITAAECAARSNTMMIIQIKMIVSLSNLYCKIEQVGLTLG